MTEQQLIEAMARAMFKDDQINRLDIARAALAVARPIIEAPLRAENEKLRAALKPFSEWSFEKYDGDDPAILELVGDLRRARAALEGVTEKEGEGNE